MTEVEAQKLVTMLVTAFPSSLARLSESQQADMFRVYRRMLVDLDSASAAAAVETLIATSRFMPTVAEIREATIATHLGKVRAGMDAWGDVRAAVGRFGRNRFPEFDDPITARAVERLGWVEFCNSDVSEAPSWRARFVELYDRLAADERHGELTRGLPAVTKLRELRESADARPKTLGELVGRIVADGELDS